MSKNIFMKVHGGAHVFHRYIFVANFSLALCSFTENDPCTAGIEIGTNGLYGQLAQPSWHSRHGTAAMAQPPWHSPSSPQVRPRTLHHPNRLDQRHGTSPPNCACLLFYHWWTWQYSSKSVNMATFIKWCLLFYLMDSIRNSSFWLIFWWIFSHFEITC